MKKVIAWLNGALLFGAVMNVTGANAASVSPAIDSALARSAQAPLAPLLERSRFLETLHAREARLSPDERNIVYLLRETRGSTLWMLDVASGATRRLSHVDGVESIYWSTDGGTVFLEAHDGIAAVPATGGRPALIARTDAEKEYVFLGIDPVLPAHVLISEKMPDGTHRLSRVGADGRREVLLAGPKRVHDLLLDAKGRLSFIRQAMGSEQVIFQMTPAGRREVFRCHYLDACNLLHHDAARDALLLITVHDDYRRLAELDPVTGELTELHGDPDGIASIDDVQMSAAGTPLIARYRPDTFRNYGLTDDAQRRLSIIENRFPDSDLEIDARTADGNWLVTVLRSSLRHEFRYLLTPDDDIKPVLHELTLKAAKLDERDMARKLPFTYTASDGMRLHAYLSLPSGVDARNAPLVALIHGGPWNRVDSTFSYATQFLVNRGYIVFSPNFRSSTGYSMTYITRANGDFGKGRVQQDIIDGVEWLLARGIGDRNRLAIAGHSFGGFSTLGGLAFTPEFFRAGFAGAPPSDFVRSARMVLARDSDLDNGVPMETLLRELLVDMNDTDAVARLSAASPRAHAANIRRPLVIWAGGRDDRVDVRDVKHFALGLRRAGRNVTLLIDPDAGHSPHGDLAREAYLYLMESLLARELGGRMQTGMSPQLERYLNEMLVFDGTERQLARSSSR